MTTAIMPVTEDVGLGQGGGRGAGEKWPCRAMAGFVGELGMRY